MNNNPNKMDIQTVLDSYRVDPKSAITYLHPGVITEVDIKTVSINNAMCYSKYKQYDVAVTVNYVRSDDKSHTIKNSVITFKDVFAQGRNKFQSFINEFDLISDEDKELHLEKLPGLICGVDMGVKYIKDIFDAEYESEQEKAFCENYLKPKSEIKEMKDVPEILKQYRIMPIIKPADSFHEYADYTAYITDVECFKDKLHSNGKTIRIKANLFNGGKTEEYWKYFSCINTENGKRKTFDKFCLDFDSVDDNGKVDIDKIKGRFCKVDLKGNGKMYIDSITPLNIDDESIIEQYKKIIESDSHRKAMNAI